MRLLVILALPIALLAQPPHGPRPWWEGDLASDLKLSEGQKKEVLQTRDDFRARLRESRSAVDRAEKDVEAAFNEDPVDQAKANEAINRLASARAEATKTVSQMDLKFRMILTAEQWQALKERQRSWPGGRGRRGVPGQPLPTQKQ